MALVGLCVCVPEWCVHMAEVVPHCMAVETVEFGVQCATVLRADAGVGGGTASLDSLLVSQARAPLCSATKALGGVPIWPP